MPPPPDPYRLAVAQAQGVARNYSRGPAALSRDEALAELAEITRGLDAPAVLAEACGLILGCCRREEERPAAERAARLLRDAGAREGLIAGWVAEGMRRVRESGEPPFGMRVT